MEKRTFLAIILSAVVLFSYDAFFAAPKRAQELKKIKKSENKELTKTTAPTEAADIKKDVKTTDVDFKAKEWGFSTKEYISNATNVGGSLHNIKIGSSIEFPLDQILTIPGTENAEFVLISDLSNKKVFQYQDGGRRITKTIEAKDNNVLSVRMEINSTAGSRMDINSIKLFSILADKITPIDQQAHSLYEYSYLIDNKVFRKWNATRFNTKEDKIQNGQIKWGGFRNHFSTMMIHPDFNTKAVEIKTDTEKTLAMYIMPADTSATVFEFTVYLGPQNPSLMKQYDKKFEKMLAFFGNGIIDAFAKGIFYAIYFIQAIFKSWGLSIILISILIYALTYPLTFQSMLSMRKMQQVQPKVKALQDRFKNDPQKLNAEIMDIYRREKINPLGGCLPFLLQMPIFIALYQVLWRAYYFQGKSFLWIKDLAMPDRTFILPFSLPFLGNELNILPILMAGVMFWQQKISAKSMVITDDQQAMQQKMMQYFFPVFIGFIFYHFASGLSLYFTVFYALSTLTQWNMNRTK